MKRLFTYSILIILTLKVNSLLLPEQRDELLSKYTTKITSESSPSRDEVFYSADSEEESYDYDADKIKGILSQYSFDQDFNFFQIYNATAKVKFQENCKCGWALSAASALSYRFKVKGLDLDLSPQYSLQCYLPDCKSGNNLLDPQLNLIKNGTVTEECLPYSSGDGQVSDICPKKCVDGTDIKKYYSQSAYLTEGLITNMDSYYQIVTLIIDQLISKGPVVARMSLYNDFIDFIKDKIKCTNEIYKYDGKSQFISAHAVVIVGYGLLNGHFYWLIQNSLGVDLCDNGFMKIEFGQCGIEKVAFSEPYIEEEGKEPYEIKLNFKKMNEDCTLDISYNSEDLEKWENTLEFNFKSEDDKRNFNIQCGAPSSKNFGKKFACYYEQKYYLNPMEKFKFKEYKSLGKDNKFIFGSIPKIQDFTYYGLSHITSNEMINKKFFVSEEGSKVILHFDDEDKDKNYLPPIYSNDHSSIPLSDCKKIIIHEEAENHNLIICELKQKEIDYFDEYKEENNNPIVYDTLCRKKQSADTYVYKLDKEKYPVFKIKKIYLEQNFEISAETQFNIETTIEGVISDDFINQNFMGFSSLESNNKNETYNIMCDTGKPDKANIDYNITCKFQISSEEGKKRYDNIYILPYIISYNLQYPFEVILKKEIKPEPKPLSANSLKLSFMVLSLFILLF